MKMGVKRQSEGPQSYAYVGGAEHWASLKHEFPRKLPSLHNAPPVP